MKLIDNKIVLFIRNRVRGLIFGRTRLGEIVNSIYDNYVFIKYSFSINHHKSRTNLESFLTKQYHIIEKGLSLPNPRKNFGINKINLLIDKSNIYIGKYGNDKLISVIKNCLNEYLELNSTLNIDNPKTFNKITNFIGTETDGSVLGGTKKNINKEFYNKSNFDLEKFLKTRVSTRQFSDKEINLDDVEKALNISRNTPSVCNRQGWKAHYYSNQKVLNDLLELQAGNSGFTESIKGLFIITSDTQSFTRLERNQIFVDGGLFSMNLILALHYLGLGSCCLNTCFPYTKEIKVKRIGNIPKQERLVMMIAIGYYKEVFRSAFSIKKNVEEIFVKH